MSQKWLRWRQLLSCVSNHPFSLCLDSVHHSCIRQHCSNLLHTTIGIGIVAQRVLHTCFWKTRQRCTKKFSSSFAFNKPLVPCKHLARFCLREHPHARVYHKLPVVVELGNSLLHLAHTLLPYWSAPLSTPVLLHHCNIFGAHCLANLCHILFNSHLLSFPLFTSKEILQICTCPWYFASSKTPFQNSPILQESTVRSHMLKCCPYRTLGFLLRVSTARVSCREIDFNPNTLLIEVSLFWDLPLHYRG